MVEKLEVGAVYEVVKNECGTFSGKSDAKYIRYTSLFDESGNTGGYDILNSKVERVGGCAGCFYVNSGALSTGQLKKITKTNNTTNNMNILEKAKLAFKGEPEKTFIKAGVMDSDENLTVEGTQLFLTFLLKKEGVAFKEQVIDPILAEDEKQNA